LSPEVSFVDQITLSLYQLFVTGIAMPYLYAFVDYRLNRNM